MGSIPVGDNQGINQGGPLSGVRALNEGGDLITGWNPAGNVQVDPANKNIVTRRRVWRPAGLGQSGANVLINPVRGVGNITGTDP